MANLTYPNHPSHLSFLSPHEPMRMTLNDKPVVAMMVQTNAKDGKRGDGTGLFLVIGKDGAMTALSATWAYAQGLRFLDYMTEDESFTVFGSSSGKPEDDPREATPSEGFVPEFGMQVGDCDYNNAQLYVPFICGIENPKLCMLALRTSGQRIILQGGEVRRDGSIVRGDYGFDYADRESGVSSGGYGPHSYADRVYRFIKLAALEERNHFRTMGTAQTQCDLSDWPF